MKNDLESERCLQGRIVANFAHSSTVDYDSNLGMDATYTQFFWNISVRYTYCSFENECVFMFMED